MSQVSGELEPPFRSEQSHRSGDIEPAFRFKLSHKISEDWTKRLGRDTQAESIVERFRHNSFVIEMGEKNMREIFENPRRKRK